NDHGQLGNASPGSCTVPSSVACSTTPMFVCAAGQATPCTQFLGGVTHLGAGVFHSVALDNNHNVWAWGDNSRGQLGDNGAEGQSAVPTQAAFPASTRIVSLAAGRVHNLALESQSFFYGVEVLLEFDALQAQARLVPQSLTFAGTTLAS